MQAIILAGGFGTRLKSAIGSDIPKPMAPIDGEPFLAHYLRFLKAQSVTRALLSLHHLPHTIQDYFGDNFEGLPLAYTVEDTPLGTGGAIRYGLSVLKTPPPVYEGGKGEEPIFVSNGDSFLDLNLRAMRESHTASGASLTIALKHMPDCSRYGQAIVDEATQRITRFQYPGNPEPGFISLGCYMINPDIFSGHTLPAAFSFEADFQRPHCDTLKPHAFITGGYFIDIGIPADYERAKSELYRVFPPLIS